MDWLYAASLLHYLVCCIDECLSASSLSGSPWIVQLQFSLKIVRLVPLAYRTKKIDHVQACSLWRFLFSWGDIPMICVEALAHILKYKKNTSKTKSC